MARRTLAGDQKKAGQIGATIVFLDESGVYLLPAVTRTYGPRGHPSVLHETVSHAHLSMISGITPDGNLSVVTQRASMRSDDVIRFLRRLMRRFPGWIIVIWDNSPIHRSKAILQFLSEESKGRIHLELLPAYAPELNPDEGVWNRLKHVELRNMCCRDVEHLTHETCNAIRRIRRQKKIIHSCFSHAGLL